GLGLKEANSPQPSFSVYPNPSTKGYQEITLAGITPHTTCTIDLFDLHGKRVQQVFSGSPESSELHIRVDLSNLTAGSYVYRVQTEIGVRQKKVVVY
ncbi:MAG: T9SS type A sorting domain-containing protein, partial [Cryomorphaceae bacterium]|nr:T9SS type A sorting domain-containing protein [Cryomorphaceae bacterium]